MPILILLLKGSVKNTVCVLIHWVQSVPEETGILAFAAAAELAAAVAEALKTVCGTSRGIKGTSLLPSAAHSAQLPAPKILQKNVSSK